MTLAHCEVGIGAALSGALPHWCQKLSMCFILQSCVLSCRTYCRDHFNLFRTVSIPSLLNQFGVKFCFGAWRMFFQGISEQFGKLPFPDPEYAPSDKTQQDSSCSQNNNKQVTSSSIPWPQRSKQLEATGSLDFATHTFPLLATIKKGSLEDAFTEDDISSLGEVPTRDVNGYLRELLVQKLPKSGVQLKAPLREKFQTVDTERRYSYGCFVDYEGQLTFQVSPQQQPYHLLQKTYGPDKVLIVSFGDAPGSSHHIYRNLVERGIFVGLRRYQYWVHKETDKKRTKFKDLESSASVRCFFVCTASVAATDLLDPTFKPFMTIADCRRHIMDIQTTESIAKYLSRLLLALSRTVKVDVDFELHIDKDLHCKDGTGRDLDIICTDGTGFISSDLAERVPMNVTGGVPSVGYDRNEACPALLQIRIFRAGCAIKGTLGIDHRLPPRTIVCRESMMKVRPDERPTKLPQVDSLELCNTSKSPHLGKLSRDLILISSVLGVPKSFFLEIAQRAIDRKEERIYDSAAVFQEIRWMTSEEAELARRMICVGVPLHEPFLHQTVRKLTSGGWQDLKKGRVELPDSYNLIGTADPTGTLQRNQVAITLSQGPLDPISCPKVAVYRAPGKHPGDVHIFEPTWNKQLQCTVGNTKYAIYFSTQGARAIYKEIGDGDLDGDRYWISKHPDFLFHLKEWPGRYERRSVPRSMPGIKPADLPAVELERTLFNEFLKARFQSRPFVGQAANYWTAHMDQYLTLDMIYKQERSMHWEQAMDACHLFYEAVNAGKSGFQVDPQILRKLRPPQMPHYLEKSPSRKVEGYGTQVHVQMENVYHSKSILGQMFDIATQAEAAWLLGPDDIEMDAGFLFPNYAQHYKKWEGYYGVYRMEMAKTLEGQVPPSWSLRPTEDDIFLKYKKILFGAPSSQERWTRILEESSALYAVVYSKAKSDLANNRVPRFTFAWKVAGYPLCEIYYRNQLPNELGPTGSDLLKPFLESQPKVPILVSYSAYHEVFLRRDAY